MNKIKNKIIVIGVIVFVGMFGFTGIINAVSCKVDSDCNEGIGEICVSDNCVQTQTVQCGEDDSKCGSGNECKSGVCVKAESSSSTTSTPETDTPATGTVELWNPLGETRDIPTVIGTAISYFLGIIGAIAVLMIIYGGIRYMTSMGNEKAVEAAKNTITYAIIGLVVCLIAIVIIQAVISAVRGV